jgi:DNA-binding response OmpR family regulator
MSARVIFGDQRSGVLNPLCPQLPTRSLRRKTGTHGQRSNRQRGCCTRLEAARRKIMIILQLPSRTRKALIRRSIMTEVWALAATCNYLRVYVRQLRAKIEPRP